MIEITETKNYYMRNTSMFLIALTATFEVGHLFFGYPPTNSEWYFLTGTVVSAYFGLSKYGEVKGV